MKNIILIAPPAAGKGTQSKMISALYNIPHISTGDLLRDEVSSGSSMGEYLKSIMDQGGLISDDVIVNLLRNRIQQVDCNNGYILDGFPRTLEQAKVYENLMKEQGLDEGIVIHMDIDQNLALKRSLDRLVCSGCGASYNKSVPALSPKIDGFCDKCGHTLATRSDDSAETFNARFVTYVKEATPIIDYYREKGIEKDIIVGELDSAEDIFNKIKKILENN